MSSKKRGQGEETEPTEGSGLTADNTSGLLQFLNMLESKSLF